ncbi:hypothetical protein PIB30_030729 [Stylosanthes scabra]|uniref:Uncharacterized protein n=1 Tax=Stylosanthes scabra TaxID=79078 RepID=A0ABU6VDV7_9FABA|nr:hypothetical protein [Stylosanthes scabra]
MCNDLVSKDFHGGLRGVEARTKVAGLRQQRSIGGSKCLWDLCFHVGQGLTSRLTGRMIGPRGSATDGSPALVLDRSGLATTTDRVSSP